MTLNHSTWGENTVCINDQMMII